MSTEQLSEMITQSQATGAFELLLAAEATPRVRRRNAWIPLAEQALAPAEVRRILFSFLSEEQRKSLVEKGGIEGFWSCGRQRFFAQIQISNRGFVAAISWIPEELLSKSFWSLPKWTESSLSRGRGLHLIAAKNKLHLEAVATSLVDEVNLTQQKMIYWKKEETLTLLPSRASVISYGTHAQVSEACDLIVCEGGDNLEFALDQADRGRSVLLLMQSHSLQGAFENLASRGLNSGLAHHFQWALCVKILQSTFEGASNLVPVFDLVAGVEPVKQLIRTQQTSELESWMDQAHSTDQYQASPFEGMRTMNQALMQMMLKRKIDLRQGFEESPSPEKLDLLLKKVGF